MTEMKWTRTAPGHYHTKAFYNGYAYRISQYKPGWPYGVEYLWEKDSTFTWRKPRYNPTNNTIAACKRSAAKHNENPRRKWVFAGRQDGLLAFVPADQNPNASMTQTALLDPETLAEPQKPQIPLPMIPHLG